MWCLAKVMKDAVTNVVQSWTATSQETTSSIHPTLRNQKCELQLTSYPTPPENATFITKFVQHLYNISKRRRLGEFITQPVHPVGPTISDRDRQTNFSLLSLSTRCTHSHLSLSLLSPFLSSLSYTN